jgi:hypothetical protein
MSDMRPGRLSRPAAERLLDDVPAGRSAGSDPLASLLAAAAAPPHTAEQAGEDAAVTAFHAERLVPESHSGRGQMIKSPLAKLLTMKVGAIALALSAGGVGVAATTGAFTPTAAHVHTPGGASVGASTSSQNGSRSGGVKATMPGSHTGASASGHVNVPAVGQLLSTGAVVKTCRQVANEVTATVRHTDVAAVGLLTETGLQSALDNPALSQVVNNPAFVSLVKTVDGRGNVANYCGLVMHVAKLASPGTLATLPASLLSAIPGSIMSQIPASALSGVPATDLAKLPTSFLAKLPASVLSGLPGSVLSKLPTSVLTGLLPKLPTGTLTQLPASLLAKAMSGLTTNSLTGVVSKLPLGLRGKTLPLLPKSLLAGLPKSLLSGVHGLLGSL